VNVDYTPTRYETLQLATTGAYRIVTRRAARQVRGLLTRYRVLRVLRDSNDRALDPAPAANGESQAVLDLWRGGLLSASLDADEPVAVTRYGHEELARWTTRWRRHQRRVTRRDRRRNEVTDRVDPTG
jgi:hypothetical protein